MIRSGSMQGLVKALLVLAAVVPLQPRAAGAAELPRVFFTPGERATITARRLAAGGLPAGAVLSATADGAVTDAPRSAHATAATAPLGRDVIRVDGVTYGPESSRAVWIGGERVADGSRWRGYRVLVARDGIRLIAVDGTVRRVRVGSELRL